MGVATTILEGVSIVLPDIYNLMGGMPASVASSRHQELLREALINAKMRWFAA